MDSSTTSHHISLEASPNSSFNFSGFSDRLSSTKLLSNVLPETSFFNFSGFGNRFFSSTRRLSDVLPETSEFNVSPIESDYVIVQHVAINEQVDTAGEDIVDQSMQSACNETEINNEPVDTCLPAVEDIVDQSMQSACNETEIINEPVATEDVLVSNNFSGMHSGMDFSLESINVILPTTPSEELIIEDVINTTFENEILAGMVFNPVPATEPEEVADILSLSLPVETLQGDLPDINFIISKGATRKKKNVDEYGHVLVTGRHHHTHTMNKARTLNDERNGFTYSCTNRLTCGIKCKGKYHVFEATARRLEEVDDTDIINLTDKVDIKCTEKHSVLCVPAVGIVERILFIKECKVLAADPEYKFKKAMVIVAAAKKKHGVSKAITDRFPDDHNVCKMINRVRKDIRPVCPKQDGTDILTWEFINDHLPANMRNFYRGDSTAVTKLKNGTTVTRKSESHSYFSVTDKRLD